jgi:hypothetical protein
VNGSAKVIQGGPVLEIAIKAVSFLHQNRPAYSLMFLEVPQHLRELDTTGCLLRWFLTVEGRVESWREQHQIAEEVDVGRAAGLWLDVLDRVRC